jgi:hypothetical protein
VVVVGVTATVTVGLNATLALADLLESPTLVAVTMTLCAAEMELGAV